MSLAISEPIRLPSRPPPTTAPPGRSAGCAGGRSKNTIRTLLRALGCGSHDPLLQRGVLGGPVHPLLRAGSSSSACTSTSPTRSSNTSSACSSSRCWSCSSSRRDHRLHHAVPLARGRLPPDHAGLDRPDLRLQVRRGDRLLELGLLPAGQPADGRLRHLTVKAPAAFYRCSCLPALVRADPGQLGAVAAIMVANVFPRRQKTVLASWRSSGSWRPGDLPGRPALADSRARRSAATGWGACSNRLAFCQHPLWPSRWMSAGLLAVRQGRLVARRWLQPDGTSRRMPGWRTWRGGRWHATCTAAATAGSREAGRRAGGSGWSCPRRASSTALFFFLPHPIRLLILKDLRTFLRDPAQWSQFLIFFGLLAFYFLNIPRLGYSVQSALLAQPRQLPQPVGDGADPLDVHQPVHLPAALARRPELLDPRALAAAARADPLGQVRLLGGHLPGGDRGPGRAQRPDAADGPGDDRRCTWG